MSDRPFTEAERLVLQRALQIVSGEQQPQQGGGGSRRNAGERDAGASAAGNSASTSTCTPSREAAAPPRCGASKLRGWL